jgi:hypothetical protein
MPCKIVIKCWLVANVHCRADKRADGLISQEGKLNALEEGGFIADGGRD